MRALVLTALVACAPASEYPRGPYAIALGATLPDLHFAGVDETGAFTDIALRDYYAPESGGLFTVMVSGGLWCGTCRALSDNDVTPRLDLVLGDRDNAPGDARAAADWQHEVAGGVAVGADPEDHFRALLDDRQAPLPLFVFIDTTTMKVVDYASELPKEQPLVDDFFRPHEWRLLQTTTVPGAPPPDPTNAVADAPAAAALGRKLFFDPALSPSGTVSCASCHRPDQALSDGRPRALGVAEGDRRTPAIALAAHARWQFWDGRADSLWSQALAPFENPRELDSSRTFVARRLLTTYRDAYRAGFPDASLPDPSAWPPNGKPGDAAYDALTEMQRDAITRLFVHAGKAIAAWERSIRVEPNPLDAYLAGNFTALDAEQKYGLQVFVRNGCMQCHWGPRLTDDAFHDIGTNDRGRIDGIAAWLDSEFRSDSRWSDNPTERRTAHDTPLGQFKTPPLRGVADLTFFGHAGTFSHLAEVTEAYGIPESTREPWLVPFGETVQWGLVPFLETLSARPILP